MSLEMTNDFDFMKMSELVIIMCVYV